MEGIGSEISYKSAIEDVNLSGREWDAMVNGFVKDGGSGDALHGATERFKKS